MKTQILEKLNDLKTSSGKTFEAVHDALGYATSTVHRWHRGESEPDMEQLTNLVEFYGGSMEDLFAAVGRQEMTATQQIGYQGADVMVTHYEARLKSAEEKYDLLKANYEQRIQEINISHGKSVEYLKDEIHRLREERNQARAEMENNRTSYLEQINRANRSAENITGKKHTVFGALVGIDVVMAIALIIALLTDSPLR
jgi:transcriptional regulator with XRE-family HTH domain